MLFFFRYLKAGIFLLAALSPVSVAIIFQVELADGNFLTDESFLKVETSLGWSESDVFQSQADGTITVFPALKSTAREDFVFITLPAGIASVTCSGLLQVDGSAGIACLDCGGSSLAVASIFNTNSLDGAGKEAGLFEFPTMDPFVSHNLTIINDGATNATSLILTHLSLNVTSLPPSPPTSTPTSTTTLWGAISPTPTPASTSTSGYYGSNTSYTDPTDTSSSSSSDAHGGLNPQQIIAIAISTVMGTSVIGLAIFVLYFTRFRRTRRQSGIIPSTSPPGDAMRASALTSAPSPITPSIDARLASLFPRRTSRPRSSPTSRRSAASQRSFTRQVPQLPLPALWRQSIQRSASMDQMLPDAEAPNDVDFIHIPRVSSPSLFSIVTDPDPDMSVPPLDPHGSASTLSSSTERGGHFPLRMNTRSPTADREDEPRSLRQTSAGDPVLPRGLPSPGRPPSPSVYSLGPSSVSGGFQRLSSELRWSRGYPETFHGSSE